MGIKEILNELAKSRECPLCGLDESEVVAIVEDLGWDSLPKGWDEESVKKFAKSLTDKEVDEKGFWYACFDKLKDKEEFGEEGAKKFCSALKDHLHPDAPYWRKGPKGDDEEDESENRKMLERLEKKQLTWEEIEDYRKDGYFVLIDKNKVDTLGNESSTVYISKSEEEVLDKYKSYKRRGNYRILNPLNKSTKITPEDKRGPGLPKW